MKFQMWTATMAEDYKKEVEVGDLGTRSQRASTKLKSSNTLAKNRTAGSFLVNRSLIKMASGIGIDYLDQNRLAVTGFMFLFLETSVIFPVWEDSWEARLKIERGNSCRTCCKEEDSWI